MSESATGKALRFVGIVSLLLGLLSVIIWVPVLQTSGLSKVERVKAETAARDVLIKGIGGSLVFITAFIGWKNLKATEKSILVSEEKHITERFSKAVEMLSSEDSVHLRLGGIYALERIAKDSERDQQQVMKILAAFVRDQTSSSSKQDDSHPYHYKSSEDLWEEQKEMDQDYYNYIDNPDEDDVDMFRLTNPVHTLDPQVLMFKQRYL